MSAPFDTCLHLPAPLPLPLTQRCTQESVQEPAGSQAVSPSVVTARHDKDHSPGLAGQERWLADHPGELRESFVEGLREAEATSAAIDVATNGLGEDMVLIEQLGEGTFGEIQKVSYKGKDYAAKMAKEGIPQVRKHRRASPCT